MSGIVAALYVEAGGVYADLPGVELWDQARDARLYAGPHPVVAHPPCQRWGKYWNGGPAWQGEPKILGDDDGCFVAALASVRQWGGVLEHPAQSLAWRAHDLNAPPAAGGWVVADWNGGWTCQVEQGAYGHQAQKPTWLYSVATDLPSLRWGKSRPAIPAHRSERWRARAAKDGICVLLSRRERMATPPEFRDVLLAMARSVAPARQMEAAP